MMYLKGGEGVKKKNIYTLLIAIIFIFTACNKNTTKVQPKPNTEMDTENVLSLNIVTTNKLLYYMVKDIVQDRHNISYMFSSKQKLWDFNFTEDSINNISKKDLFFYWGSGLEPWNSNFVDKLSKSKVGPIDISRGVKLIGYDSEVKYKDTIIKDNPYFWMNIDYYKIAMLNIKNAIEDKDTKDRDFYENNFSKNIKDVEAYQKKIKETADKLKDYSFVVEGDSLDYFLKYYGFKVLKVYNPVEDKNKSNSEDNKIVYDKIANTKNVIFLFDDESKLKSQAQLINNFNLKTVNIITYKDDIKYIEMLDHNLKALQTINLSAQQK
jgi:zinc/manganese transport system substrate-binding protein